MRYYTLGPVPAQAAAVESGEEGVRIGVLTFAVDPPYDRDEIVYRPEAGGSAVRFYPYDRWAAPLGRLAAAAVASGLEGVPGVAHAEPSSVSGRYDLELSGRLVYFEEVSSGPVSEARARLDLALHDRLRVEVWSGSVQATAEGAVTAPEDAAALLAECFQGLLTRVRQAVGEALVTADPTPPQE